MRVEKVNNALRLTPENESDEELVNDLVVQTPKIIGVQSVPSRVVGFSPATDDNVVAIDIGPKR